MQMRRKTDINMTQYLRKRSVYDSDIPCTNVYELPNSLDAGSLVKVACTNGFAYDVEISPGRNNLHFLYFHNILELSTDFASFAYEFWMEKMPHTPVVTISAKREFRDISTEKDKAHPWLFHWLYTLSKVR